ncbi:MAG: polyprenyl synthetase family protein [Candidatus Protochlamydia sp.]|nr:polyprenyl synthetase family protein [Candidatus Protochlamydia sp.]
MTNIAAYLESQGQLIEKHLDQLIPASRGPCQNLLEAARYAILGGGKRLRPILTLATVEMLGGSIEAALSAACTLEMIHTYSMIHDDLPCMDNDDYRRGKLTVHRKYSEGHAVLTGDYLLTYAFEILATDRALSADKKLQLITILSKQSGAEGMIGGQVLDMASEKKKISLDTLQLLHRNKTAALLTASVEFGGIIAEASASQLICLRQFGENAGLAFQVIDDILDVTSSETKHGRLTGSDAINEKSTYVTLLGLEQAKKCSQNFYRQAIQALKPLPYDTSLLMDIANFMVQRQY